MHDYPSNVDALEEDVKTITTAHQKSPDSLWKCVLRTTLLGILSLFMLKPSLPPGVCVNVNTYDGINVYGYARTYAVRIAVHGRVIALMSVCVCVFECVVVNCVSPRMTPPFFFSLANFTWACTGSGWEIIGLAQLWKLFAISVDWLEPQSGPCQPRGGVVGRGCWWGWN